jgi:AMP phosphorylase
MKKELKAKCMDLATGGTKVIVIHKEDAVDMDVAALDRVNISVKDGRLVSALVDLTDTFVPPGQIGLFREVYEKVGCHDDDIVAVEPTPKPDSIRFIKEKMNGNRHSPAEIDAIIKDLMNEELSDVELTAWISAIYIRGLEKDETVALAKSIVSSGSTLNLQARQIFDKHCIGGVAGNRTTMLIVPIIAAAGLVIPKTSSRAITSPAGTADSMEVLAPVSLGKEEIEAIVNKVGGCIVWGGAVNLAAADDRLIRVRHPLALDPRGMLLASILAKKKAVGATDVIIDIPIGEGAKIKTKEDATMLAKQFNSIGLALGMNVHSLITNGEHPIGLAVGPALEAIESLKILDNQPVSPELTMKSAQLAGLLLEIGGVVEEGKGFKTAQYLISSGKAGKKFREIIEMQGGDPEIKVEDIEVGKVTHTVTSDVTGRIEHVDNHGINTTVRGAGAPRDKGAGMYLHAEEGDKVRKGDPLFTLYANSERKIQQALDAYNLTQPITFARIILEEVT